MVVVLITLGVTFFLFVWGKFRYELVGLAALTTLVLTGHIQEKEAFDGFSNLAVITVILVMIVSEGLQRAGVVDLISAWIDKTQPGTKEDGTAKDTMFFVILVGTVTILSAFMNNIGALAIMLPVAVKGAVKRDLHPGMILMPMAFGSLLGGMLTRIGTPPNIIISAYHEEEVGTPLGMFDFSFVAIGVVVVSLAVLAYLGPRVAKKRKLNTPDDAGVLQVSKYTVEFRVQEDSSIVGKRLKDIEPEGDELFYPLAILRRKETFLAREARTQRLEPGDCVIVQCDPEGKTISEFLNKHGVTMANERHDKPGDCSYAEFVVSGSSTLVGKSARDLNIRHLFDVSVVAVARLGNTLTDRVGDVNFLPGDMLLLFGEGPNLQRIAERYSLYSLAVRRIKFNQPKVVEASLIFAAAITVSVLGILSISMALAVAMLLMLSLKIFSAQSAFKAIDIPLVVLLGTMIPVGRSLETSGAADSIANLLMTITGGSSPYVALALLLGFTMLMSNFINNAAAAVLMAPIAIATADSLQVSPTPMLMGVAIAASSAFLTPVGHQCNLLVMKPGGYEFRDYWMLGLPISIAVFVAAWIGIPLFWPW